MATGILSGLTAREASTLAIWIASATISIILLATENGSTQSGIPGGPMKWEDIQKLVESERKKIVEEANEDVRIKELGGIIREAVGGFMGLFQPIIGKWFEDGIDAQAKEAEGSTDQRVQGEVIKEEVKTSSEPPASQEI